MLLLTQTHQLGPDQRALGKVEGGLGFLSPDLGQPGQRIGLRCKVVADQGNAEVRLQQLDPRRAVVAAEHRTQGLVAGVKPVQAALEDLRVQRPFQPQGQGNVVGRTGAFQLIQEPQPLLRKR